MIPGPANLITDVPGLLVGNATDHAAKTGVTVVLAEEPAVASVSVMGGAPGTRETDLLAPEQTVERVDALVLSGGSAFGLESATGVMHALAERGRGFAIGPARVPIVPAAILFDLLNGGEKDFVATKPGEPVEPPYRALGRKALSAATRNFALGSVGAGAGATTAGLKGGLGSASTRLPSGVTIGAIAAVNAVGSATVGDTAHFWAAPFEIGDEFGGLGWPPIFVPEASAVRTKFAPEPLAATTIAVVATDAILTKAQAKRLAVAAHDGLARALWPAHTPYDGDLVFAVATGRRALPAPDRDLIVLSALAASTLARAIARGVFLASAAENDPYPTWADRFGAP
ncbi:P1 family peptidase [Chthonobacter rhizosphaerae]|uniref:P1 family peptidase n=1 Tax=Chthonobacter rhizosphaerae TaxID=2735553 RepID=UPI0015EF5917|nr:P1 family peptidase [Chthonobacter rhizosphaerae]